MTGRSRMMPPSAASASVGTGPSDGVVTSCSLIGPRSVRGHVHDTWPGCGWAGTKVPTSADVRHMVRGHHDIPAPDPTQVRRFRDPEREPERLDPTTLA